LFAVQLPTAAGFRSGIFATTLLVRRTLNRMRRTVRLLSVAVAGVLAALGQGCRRSEANHGQDNAPTARAATSSGGHVAIPDANVTANSDTTRERHLTLPGWEDALPGGAVPSDARQRCTDKDTDGTPLDSHFLKCKGCRSAQLPLPCIEVVSDDDGKHAFVISARLPLDDDQQVAAIIDALHTW
jgi:hypothetical protein